MAEVMNAPQPPSVPAVMLGLAFVATASQLVASKVVLPR
jgi:hypothetical protein